jgi:hypothetical protein
MERKTREPESLRLTSQCGAKRRDGLPCQKPRAKGRNRCQLHGGAPGSGALRWLGLSEQRFWFAKWSPAGVRLPQAAAAG